MNILRADLLHVDLVAPLFDAYRQFYKQTASPHACREFIHERLLKGESVIFFAMAEGNAMGFTQLYPSFSSVSMRPIMILYDLFVAPEFRRQGVAEALLRRAQDHAADSDAEGLILETAVDNIAAQRLYMKMGWKRDTLFHRYAFTIGG